jgi:hypothetical protein
VFFTDACLFNNGKKSKAAPAAAAIAAAVVAATEATAAATCNSKLTEEGLASTRKKKMKMINLNISITQVKTYIQHREKTEGTERTERTERTGRTAIATGRCVLMKKRPDRFYWELFTVSKGVVIRWIKRV